MKYAAIIFDMDGTIIDTEHIWEQATQELIASRGITLNQSTQAALKTALHGVALARACSIMKEIAQLNDPLEILIEEKRQRANCLYATNVRFVSGFTEFYTQASAHKLAMAVATNADPNTVHITDQKLNLRSFFGDHLYNISHVNYQGKPHPAIYLHAAAQLGIAPEQCIAIEDSPTGIEAARGAGMFCIGINTAQKPELLSRSHQVIEGYAHLDLKTLLNLQ